MRWPDGYEITVTYTARDDGRAYPMIDGSGHPAGTIALLPRGEHAQSFTTCRNERKTARGVTTLSPDGSRLVMKIVATGPDGKVFGVSTYGPDKRLRITEGLGLAVTT